ncbi:NADPH2:quinone reductase [Bradyrhizobium elkanii]
MKAILCSQYCQPDDLVLADVPDPVAGPGEAVIAIKAAALNFFDILMIQGKYQIKPPFPFSPAAEVAGVIESVGAGVTDLKVGDRVVASCGHNGARDKIALPANSIVKIPDNLDYDRAAGIIIIYGTALHALEDRASPKPGETLAVLGAAGGTGLAACELGKLMGLKVIACASSDEKLAFAKQHGAELTLNYAKEDLKEGLRKLTDGKGADIVFDPVGGAYAEAALRSTAWEGRFLVIGFAAGDIPKIPLNLALLKGLRYPRRVLGRLGAAESGQEPQEPGEARAVDRGRQDLLACRPHLPAVADRGSPEGARRPQGHGQGDPAPGKLSTGSVTW